MCIVKMEKRLEFLLFCALLQFDFPSCSMYMLDLMLFRMSTCTEQGDCPCPRRGHAITVVSETYVVLHGGFDGNRILDDIFMFDAQRSCWRELWLSGTLSI